MTVCVTCLGRFLEKRRGVRKVAVEVVFRVRTISWSPKFVRAELIPLFRAQTVGRIAVPSRWPNWGPLALSGVFYPCNEETWRSFLVRWLAVQAESPNELEMRIERLHRFAFFVRRVAGTAVIAARIGKRCALFERQGEGHGLVQKRLPLEELRSSKPRSRAGILIQVSDRDLA